MSDLVFKGENNQVLTNSLLVAEKFGKEHKHVLDAIREIVKGYAEFSADPMFEETTYVNKQNGQSYPLFIMTEEGFTLLAMGFTGKKAMAFKFEYIKAFKKMRENIVSQQQQPMSATELFYQSALALKEQEKRLNGVERLALEQKERLDKMEQEQADNAKALLEVELSDNKVPEVTMRNKIRKLVNQYSRATNTKQQDVWHNIYDTLYYAHNISVNSYRRKKGQSNLDIAEEHGFLGKMFDVISNMAKAANLKIA